MVRRPVLPAVVLPAVVLLAGLFLAVVLLAGAGVGADRPGGPLVGAARQPVG